MSKVASKCKTCRRLSFSVCGKEKCALKRKPYIPGAHGTKKARASRRSDYGLQLNEKQKVRFLYGVSEHQFQNYIKKVLRQSKVDVSSALSTLLESRLDNVIYRLWFAKSRSAARQFIVHGHILVNDKKVNIPSYQVSVGDIVLINPKSINKGLFKNINITLKKYEAPKWSILDKSKKSGEVKEVPFSEELIISHNIKSIIEYYSR